MFRQFRSNSAYADLTISIPGLSDADRFKYNVIMFDAFNQEERLEMGPHGRRLMIDIMHRCLIDLERRTQKTLSAATATKVIYRNKDILYEALRLDAEHVEFFFSLRPRHASKKERISPPSV